MSLTPRIDNLEASRNAIINGDMQISQRGDFTSAGSISNLEYTVDRWKASLVTVTGTLQHITASQPTSLSSSKSIKYVATSTGSGRIGGIQGVEDHEYFRGKTVTLSAWVKSNSTDARLMVSAGTQVLVSQTSHSGSGSWELLTLTVNNFATDSVVLDCVIRVMSDTGVDTSIASGDYIEFTGVMLHEGENAGEFRRAGVNTGHEWELCRRYLRYLGVASSGYAFDFVLKGHSADEIRGSVSAACGMRTTAPTLAYTGTTSLFLLRYDGDNSHSPNSFVSGTVFSLSADYRFRVQGMTGVTAGALYYLVPGGSGKLFLEAEL